MGDTQFISVKEVAKRLGVTRQRVHALIANGQLRATRLGHYHFIEEAELIRYMGLPPGKPYAPRRPSDGNSIDN